MNGTETFVVLIGVGHYPKLPAGASLQAPVHDVRAWSNFAAETLQVAPNNVVRLESPLPGQKAGEGAVPATVVNTVEAVEAMALWLDENPGGTGMLVFSGHGATEAADTTSEGDQLRLCLQDFEDGVKAHRTSVGLGEIHRLLGEVADRVTLITDCCYTGYAVDPAEDPQTHVAPITARMLLGSGEFSPAYSVKVNGSWAGLFTHALITSLALWQSRVAGDVRYIMGSHQEIVYRARNLITSMGFQDQQPVYGGPPFVAALPFNYPETTAPRGAVSLEPNLPSRKREVGSNDDIPYIWQFELNAGSNYAMPLALTQTMTGENSDTQTFALFANTDQLESFVGMRTESNGDGQIAMASSVETMFGMSQLGSSFTGASSTWAKATAPSSGILLSIPYAGHHSAPPMDGWSFKAAYIGISYSSDPTTVTKVTWWIAYTQEDPTESALDSLDGQVMLPQSDSEPAQWWYNSAETWSGETAAWYSNEQYINA